MRPVLRVMLVDDHGFVRSAIRQALTAPDIEVVGEAPSAEEALRIAPELRPDVMLIDIDLPGMNGLRLLRELRPRLPGFEVRDADRLDVAGRRARGGPAGGRRLPDQGPRFGRAAARRSAACATATWRCPASSRRGRCATWSTTSAAGRWSGGRPGLDSLSPREEEILRLLADGMTDREIGEALTISTRTVETHVSNILRKLDSRNRAEAARRYRERR